MIGLEFTKGAALLLSLTILQSFLLRVWKKDTRAWPFASGALFGGITLIGMAMPLELMPGVIFDPRSVILSVAGFWGGPIVGGIAGAMAAGYRLWLGGAGAITGVEIVGLSVLAGLLFRYLHHRRNVPAGPWVMLAFGFLTHVMVVLWLYTLPSEIASVVVPKVALPNLLVFSPATMFLGALLADIDKRLVMETSLRESEARYRQLIDSAEVSIWDEDFSEILPYMDEMRRQGVKDLRSHIAGNPQLGEEFARRLRITSVNKATLHIFGAPSEEAFIKNLHKTLLPETKKALIDILFAIWEGRESFQGIYRFRRLDDGSEVAVVASMPIPSSPGDFHNIPVSHLDVTNQVRAEEEILRLNKELEERVKQRTAELVAANHELETFAFTVSHDLRGPLQVIDGYSELLAEKLDDQLDEKNRKYFNNLRQGCVNMARLIDGILEMSRSTRGELVREPVNLSTLAAETASNLRRTEPDRRVEVAIAPDIEVVADARLMRAVLENLMGNAWKFTSGQPSARIEIGSIKANGQMRVFVRDNGAGFDANRAEELFQPFKRLHREKDFPGSGIGLSTVQRIIYRHGGKVGAEGAIGEGATIWFEL